MRTDTYHGVLCVEPGCDRRARKRHLCSSHYMAHYRAGTLPPTLRHMTPEDRWTAWADRSGGPAACWPWKGPTDDCGYGRISVNGNPNVRAFRWAYERFVGPIPRGLDLGHECHDRDLGCAGGRACPHRRCVNPSHMRPMTRSENNRAGRVRPPKRGASRTTPNGPESPPQAIDLGSNHTAP